MAGNKTRRGRRVVDMSAEGIEEVLEDTPADRRIREIGTVARELGIRSIKQASEMLQGLKSKRSDRRKSKRRMS